MANHIKNNCEPRNPIDLMTSKLTFVKINGFHILRQPKKVEVIVQLKGKTVLVTGSASGLGLACVKEFINHGANAVISDVSDHGAEEAEKLDNAVYCQTDVTSEESVLTSIDMAYEKFGSLDGVINCAGIAVSKRIVNKEGEIHSFADFEKTIRVNLMGTFNVIRLAVGRILKENKTEGERAVIVNTASVAAFEGQIGQAAYSASKGGVVSMTLPLAREMSRHGIRVNVIAPGIFDTAMLAGLPEKARASLGQQVPFPPRLGKPSEYAFLARHIFENEMINGEVIRLDGALRMGAK
jgi:NAD(P)-dependent dehydrogenase (short-subunit alcohol dehydrogenase family)